MAKGDDKYVSVLERQAILNRDMSSPEYRKYLESKQALQTVTPELEVGVPLLRGLQGMAKAVRSVGAARQPVPAVEIGSGVRNMEKLHARGREFFGPENYERGVREALQAKEQAKMARDFGKAKQDVSGKVSRTVGTDLLNATGGRDDLSLPATRRSDYMTPSEEASSGMARGGAVKQKKPTKPRGDGCAQRGWTKGRMI